MIVYYEPIGYGWKKAGDMWQIDVGRDVTIKTKDGQGYAQKDFKDFMKGTTTDTSAPVRNSEFPSILFHLPRR